MLAYWRIDDSSIDVDGRRKSPTAGIMKKRARRHGRIERRITRITVGQARVDIGLSLEPRGVKPPSPTGSFGGSVPVG
jgi:hypothetical protein